MKRFEWANGLDTVLYKNIPLPFYLLFKCFKLILKCVLIPPFISIENKSNRIKINNCSCELILLMSHFVVDWEEVAHPGVSHASHHLYVSDRWRHLQRMHSSDGSFR